MISRDQTRQVREACEDSTRGTLHRWQDEDDAKKKALEDAQKKGTMVLMC